ncbi:hypothetical protein RIF29_14162 [Crotalaria pallida]|uniref:BAG domain-containing protein n=1 Tax=Crotalaria pallida TaxID=3830 RepID=A0AAN9II00_CROPI
MNNNNNSRFYRAPWSIPSQKKKKKVVSIPVHFAGSSNSDSNLERVRNNNSAMKIQKMVRGFLVRNSMRKIKAIRDELEKIESKVCDPETKELIKRVQKERVRVSEGIMNLLLKLDSVRVLDYYSGVRDYRKFVIKKAIALQETVDQIQLGDDQVNHQDQPQLNQTEAEDADEGRFSARDSHLSESVEGADANEMKLEGLKDEEEVKMEVKEKENREAEEKKMEGLRDSDEEKMEEKEKEKEKGDGDGDGDGVGEESVGTSMVEEVEENYMGKEEGEEDEEGCKDGRGGEEGDYENKKNKELLERMMEDNERMMGMMAQLFEKNEMQTRLLSSLSHRVEQLERAYACDKLRKKKRRNVDAKHKQGH